MGPEPVLERLTTPKPSVRHALHRASHPTDQLTDQVLDLALEPAGPHPCGGHVQPTRSGAPSAPHQGHPREGRGGTVTDPAQPAL